MQGAEQVVHQRQDDIEVASLHEFAAVMQGVQVVHLADPWQAGHGVVGGQVFAGVEEFIEQVAEDHAAGEQAGDVGVEVFEQPPGGQGDDQAVEQDEPGGEQDDAPVSRAVVGHVAWGEEAVVVAGMAGVEQAGEGVFMVAQVAVDEVDAQVEEDQGEGDGQPFQGVDLLGGGPEQGDAEQAVAEDETGVEPWVVVGGDACALGGAEGLGWLLQFSVISELPYRMFIAEADTLNVLPTLALGLLVARGWQQRALVDRGLALVGLTIACLFSTQLMFGFFGVLLPLAMLLVFRRPWYFSVLPGLVCVAANQWQDLLNSGTLVALLGLGACLIAPLLGLCVLQLKQVSPAPMRRWAYALYPLHFLLLLGVRQVVG